MTAVALYIEIIQKCYIDTVFTVKLIMHEPKVAKQESHRFVWVPGQSEKFSNTYIFFLGQEPPYGHWKEATTGAPASSSQALKNFF